MQVRWDALHRHQAHVWKLVDLGSSAARNTTAPMVFTLAYSAPEVVAAAAAGHTELRVSPAADMWALGVLAYEVLTGMGLQHCE
jgi:serine/threonine protein kinase